MKNLTNQKEAERMNQFEMFGGIEFQYVGEGTFADLVGK